MILNFENKRDVAEFVNDLLNSFPNALLSITTTPQGKYVVSYVPTATTGSSEDTGSLTAKFFSETQVST